MTEFEAHSILKIRQSSVNMSGIWPGRHGAVALILFTHKLSNTIEATMKTARHLKRMDREGGQETTRRLFRSLRSLQRENIDESYSDASDLIEYRPGGADRHPQKNRLTAEDVGSDAFIDGREMYGLLEAHAFEILAALGGHVSVGPFVVSAAFLPEYVQDLVQEDNASPRAVKPQSY